MNHNRQKNRIRDCWQDRLTLSIDAVLMVLFGLIIAYPLLYIILSSFEGGSSTLSLNIWPKKWSLAGYKAVFEYRWIWIGYANSIWYTLLGTALGLVVTICCAYPLAQADLVGRNGIMALFVFTMYFGGGMIPTYLNMRNLHLLDTTLAMVLPGAVSVYNMIVTRTYFSTQIPAELHEAAQLDGCGETRYLVQVVLPLSKSILAVIGLYFAVGIWNSYFDAMMYMSTRSKMPLSIFLRDLLILNDSADLTGSMDPAAIVSLQERQNVMKYALIVVSSAPMFVLYPFVQKYFVKGVMIGSVKG